MAEEGEDFVAAFIDLLKENSVAKVVDIRTIQRSRHNPQFNRETLPHHLKAAGIGQPTFRETIWIGGISAVVQNDRWRARSGKFGCLPALAPHIYPAILDEI